MDSAFVRILWTTLTDLSFWTGFVTVSTFSLGRFNEKVADEEALDPPLPNRCFTSRFRYSSAALIYVLVYLTVFSLLVVGGAVPAFQGVLVELFGSLNVPEEIGTPAWAAMVLMVVAPTFKRVRDFDTRLRRKLMRFANIPFKARQVAREILAALCRQRAGAGMLAGDPMGPSFDGMSTATLVDLNEDLVALRHRLQSEGSESTNADYGDFFREHMSIVKNMDRKYQTVKADVGQVEADSANLRRQLTDLAQRGARVIACALLQVEAEEYGARERLRRMPGGCPMLEAAPFRFRKAQTLLGILVVFLICTIVGPIVQLAVREAPAAPAEIWLTLKTWAYWGVVGALAYLLPLVLAASVQLRLLDREESGEPAPDWVPRLMVLLATLFGCFLLAALPMFLGMTIRGKLTGQSFAPHIVAYAFVPALIAVLFIPVSRQRTEGSAAVNAIIDFFVFGVAAAAASYIVGLLVNIARLAEQTGVAGPTLSEIMTTRLPSMAFIGLVVGGAFGALQCAASRQMVQATRERYSRYAAGQAPAPDPV